MLCDSHVEIWNLANDIKKQIKKHQKDNSIGEKLKTKGLMFFDSFLHVICKTSNFNIWTAKHLAQASCTELTLLRCVKICVEISSYFCGLFIWTLLSKIYSLVVVLNCALQVWSYFCADCFYVAATQTYDK